MKPTSKNDSIEMKEAAGVYRAGPPPTEMVRTQVYLTQDEHRFLVSESQRVDKPMAALIRSYIDEKMAVPDDAWANLMKMPPVDPDWDGHEDGALNHDYYVYGTPKRYVKVDGKWVRGPEFVDE